MRREFGIRMASVAFAVYFAVSFQLFAKTGFKIDEGLLTPGFVKQNPEKYRESSLSYYDKLQKQVKCYESNDDACPDFDVYRFEEKLPLDEYAALEAEIFGAKAYRFRTPARDALAYVSSEIYDDKWYVARNVMSSPKDGIILEVCSYEKTREVKVNGSDCSFYLPSCYVRKSGGGKSKYVADYVAAAYLPKEYHDIGRDMDPIAVETVFVKGRNPSKVVGELVGKYDLSFEKITMAGSNFFVLFNDSVRGSGQYERIYLFHNDGGTSGIVFVYDGEPNGFDRAVMNTFDD